MAGLAILLSFALVLLIAVFTAMLAWQIRHPPRHTAGYAVARGLAVDPGELGLAFEEWTLERPDGVRIPVWEVKCSPAHRAGSDAGRLTARSAVVPKTAVFVHGWGHSRIDALARIAAPESPFRTMCDRIVFYDLRGHGEASGTSRLGDDEAEDLWALLERLGKGPFVLVGHSMGAVIAMKAAGRAADPRAGGRIIGIIAYGPYLDFHRSLCRRLRTAGYPARPITHLAMLVHRLCGVRPREMSSDEILCLRCELLLVHGAEDQVAPLDDVRSICDTAMVATLVEIPGADHLDAHEVDRSRHDAAVGEFLARVVGG